MRFFGDAFSVSFKQRKGYRLLPVLHGQGSTCKSAMNLWSADFLQQITEDLTE